MLGTGSRKGEYLKSYIRRYDVSNLYRFVHPEGYRSMYTIEFREGYGLCPIILDLRTHKDYDRVFGYHGLF